MLLPLILSVIAATDAVEFTPEKFLMIDGRPRLILGLYENPEDDAVLADAVAAGYNFFMSRAERESLDRLHAHGVYAWIPLGMSMALDERDTERRERLADVVNEFKDHPAVLSWEAPDESLWNQWHCAYEWIFSEQPRALAELIEKNQDAEAAQRQRDALARAVDYTHRGLWKQSEDIYDALWRELGEEPRNPELRKSRRMKAAVEVGEQLSRGWEQILELDRRSVLWQNHAPRNSIEDLRAYNRLVHAAGCDIYPAPANYLVRHSDLPNNSLCSVGAYTRRMQLGAPGKACWMVLQGFGWRDIQEHLRETDDERLGRRPTWRETRFMAYNSLVHGANAVIYWGTAYIEKDSELWRDILRIGAELRALEPAIVAPKPQREPVVTAELNYASFDGDQPLVMLREYRGPDGEDEWALIAVNERYMGVAFSVEGLPAAMEGRRLHRLYTDESVAVENGGFRDGIRGYDAHVYATTRCLEADGTA